MKKQSRELSRCQGKGSYLSFVFSKNLRAKLNSPLVSGRKGDPVCSIVVSFDTLRFEALIRRGASNGGKWEVYGLSSLSKLDDLLGERWYVRGINSAGDFCYIEPGTVKFYLKCQCQKLDFQLQDDSTMKTQYFGSKHKLVFKFVRSNGTLTQWNSVLHSCYS